MLSNLLEHEGYQPHTAVNSRDALTALAAQAFDAVLLDIVTPEVDSMEVPARCSRLRRVLMIVISLVDEVEHMVACLDLGTR